MAYDPAALLSMINRAFALESFFLAGDRLTPEEFRHRMETGTFLTLDDAGALAAAVWVQPRGDRAYMGLLTVDPDRQGRGLGSRMVEQAEQYCRAQGARFLDITVVNLREELPPFYRKRGYVETGTAQFDPNRPLRRECHLIEMSKPL